LTALNIHGAFCLRRARERVTESQDRDLRSRPRWKQDFSKQRIETVSRPWLWAFIRDTVILRVLEYLR